MWDKLRLYSREIRLRLRYYRAIIDDPHTPKLAKTLLGIALGYLVLPVDIIPDFIPVLGYLDDLIIIPGLVWLAMRLVPGAVKETYCLLLDDDTGENECHDKR